jgi:hypothetical protein
MGPENTSSVRAALQPSALRAALTLRRPVFGNPWDSEVDMFACYAAVSVIDPLLLWCGGELMSSIFGFGSRWPLGVFLAAALVGAAGFMTIVGRERTSLSVDVLAITAWVLLGVVVAPVLGLALPRGGSNRQLRGLAAGQPPLRSSLRSLGNCVSAYRELASDMELAGPVLRPERAPTDLLSVARGRLPTERVATDHRFGCDALGSFPTRDLTRSPLARTSPTSG